MGPLVLGRLGLVLGRMGRDGVPSPGKAGS